MNNKKELQVIDFNWDDKRWKGNSGAKLFEELCWELIDLEGFQNLEWRGDTHDKGRDLQADYILQEPASKTRTEKWWFQCKRYSNSINYSDMGDAFAHAETENIDVFVIMSSSTLTNTFQEMIDKWNRNKVKDFKTKNYNYKVIERLVKKHITEITNLEKYFDLDRNIEKVREELSRKEQEQLEKAYELKEELEKRLESIESNPSALTTDSLQKTIDKCEKLFQSNLKNEAINLLSKLSNIEDFSNGIQFKIQLTLGNLYSKREWISHSINHYAKAEDKSNTRTEYLKAKLKKGKALRLDNQFHRAKNVLSELYDDLKEVGDNKQETEFFYKTCLEQFKLHYEYEDLKKAANYLDKISTTENDIFFEKTLGKMQLTNSDGNWNASINQFEKIDLVKAPTKIQIQINLEAAFAYYQRNQIDLALKVLKEKCLPLVEDLGDEDRLMVIYQNITHLKNARRDRQDSFWESYNKWSNLYNKNLSDFQNAKIKGLNATDAILNERYNRAIKTLNKSERIYSEFGSWNALKKNNERLGYAYLKDKEYKFALDYFIKSSSEDYIKKTSNKILKEKKSTEVNDILEKYLNKNNLTVTENIGFCHSIKHLHEIIKEEKFPEIADKLKNLTFQQFSIDPNFDLQRPAIDALISICNKIDQEKARKIIRDTFKIVLDENTFWDTKEKLLKLYDRLEQSHPGIISNNKGLKIFDLLTEGPEDLNNLLKQRLIQLLYQIANNNEELKGKLYSFFQEQGLNSISLQYLMRLGFTPDKRKVEQLLEKATETISNRIVIEDNFEEDSKHPEIENAGIITTKKDNGKRITIGTLPNLNFLTQVDLKKVDQTIVEKLVAVIKEQINYKVNIDRNRIELLHHLSLLELNTDQAKKVISYFWDIIEQGIQFSEDNQEDTFTLINKLSNRENLVIAYAIRGLNNNYSELNRKKDFWELIKNKALIRSFDIKSVVLESFANCDINDEEFFLRYFAILNSSDNRLVIKSLELLTEENLNRLSRNKLGVLIDTLISLISKFDNSVKTLISLKNKLLLLKGFKKTSEYREKINNQLESLDKHRFYSVRYID